MRTDDDRRTAELLASARFHVSRRLPWTEQDLGAHADRVVDALRDAPGAMELEIGVDLRRAMIDLSVRFIADPDGAERTVRHALGRAIRGSGAVHVGLLPIEEESRLKAEIDGPWAGLRIPYWQIHSLEVTPTIMEDR